MDPIWKASLAEWHCGPLQSERPFEPELREGGVAAAQLLMNKNKYHNCQNTVTKACSVVWFGISFLPINPLKPSGNYIYHRLLQSVTLHFVYMDLVQFLV
jgi:hypothetical protein